MASSYPTGNSSKCKTDKPTPVPISISALKSTAASSCFRLSSDELDCHNSVQFLFLFLLFLVCFSSADINIRKKERICFYRRDGRWCSVRQTSERNLLIYWSDRRPQQKVFSIGIWCGVCEFIVQCLSYCHVERRFCRLGPRALQQTDEAATSSTNGRLLHFLHRWFDA